MKWFFIILFNFLIVNLSAQWPQYRGINISILDVNEENVRDFALTGGNLFRISMPLKPVMVPIEPEFNGKRYIDSSAFEMLDHALNLCEKYDIKVVIDPHTFPGQHILWTMLGYDKIWIDKRYHNYIIEVWENIAKKYASRGNVIAGYDLLNEPDYNINFTPRGADDLNFLYRKIITAIRKYDTIHTVIVAAPHIWDKENEVTIGYTSCIKYIVPIIYDDNVVYEVHFYDPKEFTEEALSKSKAGPYPGYITGVYWNKKTITQYFKNTIEFKKTHNADIFLGEFSCPRWLGPYGGNIWIEDVIKLCEKHNISWAYHAWREASCWDAEKSNINKDEDIRLENTERMAILKKYYKKNKRKK
ncbi:glycoside hydrolase family 5 protein [Parabacteroides pacaensis]|uniref:glycoside hydrolase family 5 protein n=1 Tax=Parabacteroides pacaensis TaxID=2086575 RepID=UPI000D0EA032|nr:cellulase family glycosylhydrolase [Parabacteroides pacaensis]